MVTKAVGVQLALVKRMDLGVQMTSNVQVNIKTSILHSLKTSLIAKFGGGEGVMVVSRKVFNCVDNK